MQQIKFRLLLIRLTILASLFMVFITACYAQKRNPITLATMPLQPKGVVNDEALMLTSRLNSELVRLGVFRVVERARVDELLKEMGFQQSGACDEDKCVAQVGKLLGVQYMVGGEIGLVGEAYTLEVRLINVSSGQIIRATSDTYQGPIEGLLEIMKNVALKLNGRKVQSVTVTHKKKPSRYSEPKSRTVGLEADALPFATGGHNGSIWYGQDKFRLRGHIAKINTPGIFLRDGFEKDSLSVYGLNIEYFVEDNFEGFWIGSGIQYWEGSVGHIAETARGKYEYIRMPIVGGYVWKFFPNLYLNCWGGFYLFVQGDKEILVGNRTAFIDDAVPIVSVAVGWHF